MSFTSNYKLNLFKAQSGYDSALIVHKNDNTVLHLHSTVKPENESDFFDSLSIWGDRIVLLGCGLGYHVKRCLSGIKNDLLIIDYYPECVDLCKKILTNYQGKITAVSSENGEAKGIVEKFIRSGGMVQVIKHPASYFANRAYYDCLMNQNPFGSKKKTDVKKVALIYANFFLQEELKNAIKACSLDPILVNLNSANSIVEYESNLQQMFQKEKPDLVITVNMIGMDSNGILSDLAQKYGIPVAVWFVDDPRPILVSQRNFVKENMIAFCWERSYISFLKQVFRNVHYLPLATDMQLFNRDVQSQNKRTKIGFVGSSMGETFLGKVKSKFLWYQKLEPVVHDIAEKLSCDRYYTIQNEIGMACLRYGVENPYKDEKNSIWFQSYIIHYASMIKRRKIVDSLIKMGIELFGDPPGWREFYGEKVVCHPDIDYRHGLASVYRGIDVNINITSCQMQTAVNQRVFDIPACGSFLISDDQSDLYELFASNEIVTYESARDLEEKVTFYSQHEKERNSISKLAMNRIANEHTYAHRLLTIIDMCK